MTKGRQQANEQTREKRNSKSEKENPDATARARGIGNHELKLIVDDKNHPVRVEIPIDETLVLFERIGQSPFS